ncbi:DNA binding domain-containing protein, excisionase family [Carboxydocella thermautotrophica]|nr:DNA binding domain-containing protein, excisionase family [Carboxydocella thermautotrophica]
MQEQAPLKVLTVQEVAQVLKTDREKVEKLIASGRLPAMVLPGQEVRIRAEDLLTFLKNETAQYTELKRKYHSYQQERLEKLERALQQLKIIPEKLNHGLQGELNRAAGDYSRVLELKEVFEDIYKLTRRILKAQQRVESRKSSDHDDYFQQLEIEWQEWEREIEKWQDRFLTRAKKAGKKLNFGLAQVYQNLVQILINEWDKIRKENF